MAQAQAFAAQYAAGFVTTQSCMAENAFSFVLAVSLPLECRNGVVSLKRIPTLLDEKSLIASLEQLAEGAHPKPSKVVVLIADELQSSNIDHDFFLEVKQIIGCMESL